MTFPCRHALRAGESFSGTHPGATVPAKHQYVADYSEYSITKTLVLTAWVADTCGHKDNQQKQLAASKRAVLPIQVGLKLNC